jgi:hypothetical protein
MIDRLDGPDLGPGEGTGKGAWRRPHMPSKQRHGRE